MPRFLTLAVLILLSGCASPAGHDFSGAFVGVTGGAATNR